MKSTGIVRKVDELGRVVIPVELRRSLGIDVKDPVEIFIDDNQIILQKYAPDEEKTSVVEAMKTLALTMNVTDAETLQRAINLIK